MLLLSGGKRRMLLKCRFCTNQASDGGMGAIRIRKKIIYRPFWLHVWMTDTCLEYQTVPHSCPGNCLTLHIVPRTHVWNIWSSWGRHSEGSPKSVFLAGWWMRPSSPLSSSPSTPSSLSMTMTLFVELDDTVIESSALLSNNLFEGIITAVFFLNMSVNNSLLDL